MKLMQANLLVKPKLWGEMQQRSCKTCSSLLTCNLTLTSLSCHFKKSLKYYSNLLKDATVQLQCKSSHLAIVSLSHKFSQGQSPLSLQWFMVLWPCWIYCVYLFQFFGSYTLPLSCSRIQFKQSFWKGQPPQNLSPVYCNTIVELMNRIRNNST